VAQKIECLMLLILLHSPEGIEALCSDLEVDYTDVRILMLAWKMNAQKQGYFTQDEWRRGLKALRVDTVNKLKKTLPELEEEVLKSENFEDFYKFAFRYCLTEEKQKCLDIESACILIELVLGFQYQPQVDSFIAFLKTQSDYKVLNMDQWTNFLRFCQEISFPDLQNYDTCEAWPLLLDNFVDWMKQKANVIPD
ncbi:UNVERIFIED_CONTAM: DCN1-like protein 4, partial [Sesamum indicum]